MNKILQYIIPINLMFDIVLSFFDKGGVLSIFRASMMIFLILPIILKNIHNNKYYRWNLVFCFYVIINILFSSDIVKSSVVSFKIIISISMFIVGFNFFSKPKNFRKLNNSIYYALIILLLNFVLSNVFNIGTSVYSEDGSFLVGNLKDNWNVFTYTLLVVPLLLLEFKNNKKKTTLIYFLAIINSIILILSVKRIAVGGLFLGFFLFGLLNLKFKGFFKNIIILTIVAFSTFPFYGDLLSSRIGSRSDRFEAGSLEKEGRFLETFVVWEEVFSFEKPSKSIFGLEAFNSVGNYAKGTFGVRNLHVDYNLIVNTIGLLGFVLYFFIFFEIYKNYRLITKKIIITDESLKMKKTIIIIFLLVPFFTSFAGQMYGLTFRSIIFIYLGANIGSLTQHITLNKLKAHESINSL
ncbi:hypothetical protein OAV73_02095 [Flavobacteriaceae bacterium]|nr:hypothetical protein [Flavobacteriaceae bacterium]